MEKELSMKQILDSVAVYYHAFFSFGSFCGIRLYDFALTEMIARWEIVIFRSI
jgi:hypothetical protein